MKASILSHSSEEKQENEDLEDEVEDLFGLEIF
jgi:hypothetical protein